MARRALMLRLTDLLCSDHSFRQSGNCVRQTQRHSISRWPIQSLSIRRTGPICLLRSRLLQYCIILYSILFRMCLSAETLQYIRMSFAFTRIGCFFSSPLIYTTGQYITAEERTEQNTSERNTIRYISFSVCCMRYELGCAQDMLLYCLYEYNSHLKRSR